MNIQEAKEQIKDTVEAYLRKDDAGLYEIALSRQRPVFLVGAPGIGKTAIMEQIAQELNIGIVSYSMTHHTRQSALGLPRIEHREFEGYEYEASEYTMSEIVATMYDYMQTTGLRCGILFLDEINCVSETLYPSMLQFLQFKTFGRHRIPNDWIVVCAGNPPEYNKSVHEFDVVTLDRLREIHVDPDYAVWKRYATEKGLHPAVTTFLEAKPDCFYSVSSKPGGGKSFVTARGWEDLAETIALYEKMCKKVDRSLFVQFLRDDQIADDFSIYYSLFEKYRSDYQVGRILAGEASADIYQRAQNASFDERIALIGLVLDALGTRCRATLEQEAIVMALRDELREAKPKLLEGGEVEATVGKAATRREQALERRIGANTASTEHIRRERFVVKLLRQFMQDCALARTTAGAEGFHTLSNSYKAEVGKIDPLAQGTSGAIDNAFDFIEGVWGSGREMIVFVAELTTRKTCTTFISHYGNEKYYAHNGDLKVDATRNALTERIASLDLSVPSGVNALRDTRTPDMGGAVGFGNRNSKAAEAEQLALDTYYNGKAFEWGFASMSRMNFNADDVRGKRTLNVCCRRGKGAFKMSAMAGSEGRIIGTDWNAGYVDEARADSEHAWRKSGLKANNMEFLVAYPEDLSEAGIGDESVDTVYINNVMTLLYDQQRALGEFCRVLKGDGKLICETIFASAPRDEEVVKKARTIGNSIQAARTQAEFEQWAQAAGFTRVEVVDSFEVAPETGFKAGREVEVVESSEDVTFSAVVVHAYK